MAIFKCKMCGGTIEFNQGDTVGVCDSCGTKQTLPRLDDDRKTNLYDRANHFRRNNDFDKAMGIYEQILNQDDTDAEAYWSLVLCRYGIEYVEDPATHKRVPTVNRAQYTSIYADEDYKAAIQHADIAQKIVYEEEAKAIDNIQKGILEISQKEEPFDVFICYKETDANGRRTQDSVLANDLYHQLTQEGFKVFFARITLEDKLGSAYEPYIFAALNSAKVMVVLGTKPEYFNAVWVKNEWSRYLALCKNNSKKMLIPAYRDMDPYDLPEEFSHLQAQDMSKLGFMQDLIRGIKKIIAVDVPKATVKETVVINNGVNANIVPLLKRAFMFLEDGDWDKADDFCEQVLNQDPENAQAYLGKLMALEGVRTKEALKDCAEPFDSNSNYQKILRFGDDKLTSELREYISHINDRNLRNKLEALYGKASEAMASAGDEISYKLAAERFMAIKSYKDAETKMNQCLERASECKRKAAEKAETDRKNSIYEAAQMKANTENVPALEEAIKLYASIPGWKDADSRTVLCRKRIEEIKAKEEADRIEAERLASIEKARKEATARKRKKIAIIVVAVAAVIAAAVILFVTVIKPSMVYNKAVRLEQDGDFVAAYDIYSSLGEYHDSSQKCAEVTKKMLINASIGDEVKFGKYEQDNDTLTGKEDVEWIVLAKENGQALIISKYALDCQPYNSTQTGVTWENCGLRTWLNETFLNDAFSTYEQSMIATTNVSADKNPKYSTNPGNATNDKVFLLGIAEVKEYFTSDSSRQCKPTKFAVANGAYERGNNGNCWWWLRSPGYYQHDAAGVRSDGAVDFFGYYVDIDDDCIRPALWINLES